MDLMSAVAVPIRTMDSSSTSMAEEEEACEAIFVMFSESVEWIVTGVVVVVAGVEKIKAVLEKGRSVLRIYRHRRLWRITC